MDFKSDLNAVKEMLARGDRRLCAHSGQVKPGDIFAALSENVETAAKHIDEAIGRGASVIIAGNSNAPEHSSAIFVHSVDVRQTLGELAAIFFKTNPLPVPLIGITGTNGKTTISYLLEHILKAAGFKTGLLGTINYRWPGFSQEASLTTPGCFQVHEMLQMMVLAGAEASIMEVSSHALAQKRVAGLIFDLAVFTNLSQDHLDYHKDMESYFQCKARLFLPEMCRQRVVNQDDPAGRTLLEAYTSSLAYGLAPPEEWVIKDNDQILRGEIIENSIYGLKLRSHWRGMSWDIVVPSLSGRHNAANLLAAQGAALALGVVPEHMRSLASFAGVPGRLERIVAPGRNIFVDFAHTPDALRNVLKALAEINFKRRIVVFGCGGNRDRGKRPLMGRAVAELADVAVLTSDNPRDEDPMDIINDVLPGLEGAARVIIEPDRRRAVALAMAECDPEDVLLVAGKGHEPYQEIKGVKHPYSDHAVILEQLSENGA